MGKKKSDQEPKDGEAIARLEDIEVEEVSLVPQAANRFPFLLVKRQNPIEPDPGAQDFEAPLQGGKSTIFKLNKGVEERLAMGVILVPNKPDGQGDIATPEAVSKAAHRFLSKRQQPNVKDKKKLGVMHTHYDRELELVESYIAPVDMEVEGRKIVKGSWVVTFRVLDESTWSRIKKGELRGFSLMGTGRGRHL